MANSDAAAAGCMLAKISGEYPQGRHVVERECLAASSKQFAPVFAGTYQILAVL